jgi:ABC-type phosphate transport system permease subunit
MNYRYQIQGRYFLVALFSLNIMTIPFALSIIKSTAA